MKFKKSPFSQLLAIAITALLPATAIADVVSVPFGTRVFIELDQQVISKKKKNREGSFVKAHVWRDVVVDGKTVAQTGTPVMVKISHIKSAKVAGIKGHVELEALQVSAIDGADLMLTGGYDQSGKGRMALSITLAAVVFVPLIFIKGKQAKLPPGTIFDAMVAQPTDVDVPDAAPRKVRLGALKSLEVEVLYDILEQQGDKNLKDLPLKIQMYDKSFDSAQITHINNEEIKPIVLEIGPVEPVGENAYVATANANLKALGKHFNRGFNQFTVEVAGETAVVMLDIEL